MVRVVAIEDGRTITVDRAGTRARIPLAGVQITDDARARELLKWTALETWVMLEPAEGGEFLVYRSPDALLLNRELVVRGYARSTLAALDAQLRPPSRYLGEIDLPAPSKEKKQPRARVTETPGSRKSSGTSRRSTAPPSRRARVPARTRPD